MFALCNPMNCMQHTSLLCPSPWDGLNSCPLSQWRLPTILPSVALFSSCSESFPQLGSFLMNQLFASGGQSIGASVFLLNIQGWYTLGLAVLISLLSKGLVKSLLQQCNSKTSIFQCSAFLMVQFSNPYMILKKKKLWLDGPLLVMWCVCFLICYLGLS